MVRDFVQKPVKISSVTEQKKIVLEVYKKSVLGIICPLLRKITHYFTKAFQRLSGKCQLFVYLFNFIN